MLHDLILNAALLIVLSVFYEFLVRYRALLGKTGKILMGFLFGMVAVIGMNIPLEYSEGIFYDGRSIVLPLAGLFGGGWVAVISGVIAAIYRVWIGGAGMWAGLATIASVCLLGVAVRQRLSVRNVLPGMRELLFVAFTAQIVMLLCQLLIPWPQSIEIITGVGPVVLVLFTSVTLLIGGHMTLAERRLLSEQALKESEDQFRRLFEEHSAIKLLIDPEDGSIVHANHAAEKFYGWSVEQLRSMNIDRINTLLPEKIKEEMNRARRQERNHFNFRHRLADGSVRDVEVFSSIITIKGKDYLPSIVHDVTEKKKTESRLKLLSKSVEQSPVAIIITDEKGLIFYVNPVYTRLTGFGMEEIVGLRPRIFDVANHSDQTIFEEMQRCLNAHTDWQGEFLNKKKNGETFWEKNYISPMVDETGHITNYILIKEDISIQKKLIGDLKEARDKAEVSQRLKSAFLANMSHEIRTPLNGILGFTELLTSDPDLPKEQREEYGLIIRRSANGLLQIINDVLELSKLESEQPAMMQEVFNLNHFLNSLYQLYRKKMKDSGKGHIGLHLCIPDDEIEVVGDENRLNQVMINLLDNALKFTEEGEIRFGISGTAGGKIELMVSDTGIGIKPEKQEIIFEQFIQGDDRISRQYGGTGLGLSIVKKLTSMMGDGVKLESEPGQGSTFRFNLPGKMVQ